MNKGKKKGRGWYAPALPSRVGNPLEAERIIFNPLLIIREPVGYHSCCRALAYRVVPAVWPCQRYRSTGGKEGW